MFEIIPGQHAEQIGGDEDLAVAFGAGAGKEFGGFSGVVEQIAAVGSFFGHIIYAFGVGLIIVLRSVAAQFAFGPGLSVLVTGMFVLSLLIFSRYMLRIRRT